MSSGEPSSQVARLFPKALIRAIGDAETPERGTLLAMARHLRRDLPSTLANGLSLKAAVCLSERILKGDLN
jgi:hypothetical protein